MLALGFHTGGVLGKLFSEVIEDVNPQPIEALQGTGASTAAVLAYGIFPLALPQLVSYTLYRWEVNIAAIIGVVGAGGIGRDIYVAISLFHYQQLLTLLLMTLIIVTLVDYLSAWVRALQRVRSSLPLERGACRALPAPYRPSAHNRPCAGQDRQSSDGCADAPPLL